MLTEKAIQALKPRAKVYRVADGGGLCIEVKPSGSKLWRYRYRYQGRANLLALGRWNEVTLSEARESHRQARKALAAGTDPMAARRLSEEEVTRRERVKFANCATEWLEYKKKRVGNETYRKAKYVVEGDLIPVLRRHTIDVMATKDVMSALDKIATRAPNLAVKARQYLGGIVAYAIQQGLREDGRTLTLRGTVA